MRNLSMLVLLAIFGAAVHPATAAGRAGDEARQAVAIVAAEAAAAIVEAGVTKATPIAILPLANDPDQRVAGALKGALSAAGIAIVEGKDEPFMEEILREVEWNERRADMIDAATIVKFGKLQAAKLLLHGNVREFSSSGGRGFVEVELHLGAIATKRHLWSRSFARRFYLAADLRGVISLDDGARQALAKVFDACQESMAKIPAATAKSVLVVPLAGDIDQYATGMATRAMMRSGAFQPRDRDVQTLAEAYQLLRDDPAAADAVLHGAIRDLSLHENFKESASTSTNRYFAEIQMRLVNPANGDILWVDNIRVEYDENSPKDSIQDKIDRVKTEMAEQVIATIAANPGDTASSLGGTIAKILLVAIVAIVALVAFVITIRFFMTPR